MLVIASSAIVTVSALTVEDPTFRCRAEERTLEVAVEAFVATKDRLPQSEAELVDAGFMRSESSHFDLDDDEVVPSPGSPCIDTIGAFGDSQDTAVLDRAGTASAPSTPPPEICSPVDAAFERLDQLDGTDVQQLSTELHAIATTVRGARGSTDDPTLKSEIDAFTNLISGMAMVTGLLDENSPTADAKTRITIDDLSVAVAGYLGVIHTSEIMVVAFPKLAAVCGTGFVAAPQLVSAIRALKEALDAFLATDLGQSTQFSTLATMNERLGTLDNDDQPRSSMSAEFDECRAHPEAATLGDNDGCDGLFHACSDGDMAACDDLFMATFPGSNYSVSGATCGGRTQPGGLGYAGFCTEIDEP